MAAEGTTDMPDGNSEGRPSDRPTIPDFDLNNDTVGAGQIPEGDKPGSAYGDEEDQEGVMDEAGNLDDFDMKPVPVAATAPVRDQRPLQPSGRTGRAAPTVPGLRIR